jgi:hypothetical protein
VGASEGGVRENLAVKELRGGSARRSDVEVSSRRAHVGPRPSLVLSLCREPDGGHALGNGQRRIRSNGYPHIKRPVLREKDDDVGDVGGKGIGGVDRHAEVGVQLTSQIWVSIGSLGWARYLVKMSLNLGNCYVLTDCESHDNETVRK